MYYCFAHDAGNILPASLPVTSEAVRWLRQRKAYELDLEDILMKIGELAGRAGCAVETVRYYEKEGLLAPPTRNANNYRSYQAAQGIRRIKPLFAESLSYEIQA